MIDIVLTAVLITLAATWSFACIVGPLALGWSIWKREDMPVFAMISTGLLLPIGTLLAIAPWGMFIGEDITLKKSDWACTRSHEETVTTPVRAGAVMTTTEDHVTVCDQYNRK